MAFLEIGDWNVNYKQLIVAVFVVLVAIWKLHRRKSANRNHANSSERVLTREEEDKIIEEWEPESLVPNVDPDHYSVNPRIVSKYGNRIVINGRPCIDLATHDYLNFARKPECIDQAISAAKKYGVGSCGPRGFFGTVDVHVELETKIAEFMGTEEAILYSYGYSAISSAIPAYAKANDVIFADENCNYAIQQGLKASRSKIRFFNHNDMDDLERQLAEQRVQDRKHGHEKVYSRFIVVEGLFINTADICPLPKIIELKKKYKIRLFIDDSIGFGVLGNTGRGICEHFSVPVGDVDLIAVSLEYACAAYGGFCAGTHFIIDHQRLSGLGYCFSASLPPLQAAVAIRAIDLIDKSDAVTKLAERCQLFHNRLLEKIPSKLVDIQGEAIAPIKHVRFTDEAYEDMFGNGNKKFDFVLQTKALEKVVNLAFDKGYAITVARYIDNEHLTPKPSIRLAISIRLTEAEVNGAINIIAESFNLAYEHFKTSK